MFGKRKLKKLLNRVKQYKERILEADIELQTGYFKCHFDDENDRLNYTRETNVLYGNLDAIDEIIIMIYQELGIGGNNDT